MHKIKMVSVLRIKQLPMQISNKATSAFTIQKMSFVSEYLRYRRFKGISMYSI